VRITNIRIEREREERMKKRLIIGYLAMVVGLAVILGIAAAPWAAETVSGKIMAVSQDGDAILLEDGTELVVPSTIKVSKEQLKAGATVKVTYEEAGDEKVVRSIEVQPSRSN